MNGSTNANDGKAVNGAPEHSTVLVVGGAVVGCFTALKLGQAGIDVTIIERQPTTSDSPRAVGYYGAAQLFMDEVGVYKFVRDEGFMTRGLCWRKRPTDDGKGGKQLGDVIARQHLCAPDETVFEVSAGQLNLPQADLNKIVLRQALKTGHVKLHFNTELVSILHNEGKDVTVLVRDINTNVERKLTATYLVGADGARSQTRKALGIAFAGHTWPERLIATNALKYNEIQVDLPTWYTMDRVHYTITTPLEEPVLGKKTLWRYTIAADPADTRPDEELISDENIFKHYENVMSGPRPLQVQIEARSTYRIHQRLASTLRKGNCLLAGDAAHVNNPYGALGLNTGILDADALAEALIMILKEQYPPSLLDIYSDERRKVFQFFVDPTSTQNKLRVHSNHEDEAVQNDWFFRLLQNPTYQELKEMAKPYFETWRTNIRKLAEVIQLGSPIHQ
ncbi:hypothetical protein LTR84_009476 [Exophiala bonariae]|uniref:FAD-binding domain-containing protein n=1 Tax=Exophiala bonariae TaxID=1690606 RepID=A0AAV9MUJ2_9EURO|nr:hypothetical protein LTR84_009476 [Exophiala bonariae]